MRLNKKFAAALVVATLVMAPLGASAGGGKDGGGKPGGGKGGGDTTIGGCTGPGTGNGPGDDCNVLSEINVVNLNGDLFNIVVNADRALSNNEITLIEGGVLTQINLGICNSNSIFFNGEQCTVDVGDVVTAIIIQDVVDIYLNNVTVTLNTVVGNVFKHTKNCGCPSKK